MRIFIRVIVPLVLIAFGVYLVWIYFIEPRAGAPSSAGPYPYATAPGNAQLPQGEITGEAPTNNAVGLALDGPLAGFWIRPRDNALFGVREDGTIAGTSGMLSGQRTGSVRTVIPAPDGERAVVGFGSRASPSFSVFTVATKTWRPLPQGTTAAAWSPEGNRLALLAEKGGAISLELLDLSAEKTQTLLSLAAFDLTLAWPDADTILLGEPPSRETASSLWSYSITNRTLTTLFNGEAGLTIRWNAGEGLKLSGRALSLIQPSGAIARTFSFLALPEKCAWNQTRMVCAIPRDLASRVIPDDYRKQKNTSSDDLYEVNRETGTLGRLILETKFDAAEPALRGNALYLIDRYSGDAYALDRLVQ